MGIWLYQSQKRAIIESETEIEENATERALNPKTLDVVWMVALILVIVAQVLFMFLYYCDAIIDIVNTSVLIAVVWACAQTDRIWRIIPNRILIIGLVIRSLIIAIHSLLEPTTILQVLTGCLVAAVALFIVSLLCRLIDKNAIGFGDVKLLILMGLYLGTDRIWGAVLFSMLSAFVFSLYLVLAKHAGRKTEIPFAPLLFIGTVLSSLLTTV